MSTLTDLVGRAEQYLEQHIAAVKDLVELVPRIEKIVQDIETATSSTATPTPAGTTPAAVAAPEPPASGPPSPEAPPAPSDAAPAPEQPPSPSLPWAPSNS